MEENKQHFLHIMLYYFKKGKSTTEMQEEICAGCGEGAVRDRTCVKNALQSSMLAIPHRTMLRGRVDQLLLIAINSRH